MATSDNSLEANSAQLTLFAEVSPVSLTVLRGSDEARPTSDGYGQSLSASFAEFDHASCSWKMYQVSLFEGPEWTAYSETWPASGTMRNGKAYQRPQLVPRTSDTESSLLPTITSEGYDATSNAGVPSLLTQAREMWPSPNVRDHHAQGAGMNPKARSVGLATLIEKMWPTPKSSPSGPDFARVNREDSGGDDLATAVARWPTPRGGTEGVGMIGGTGAWAQMGRLESLGVVSHSERMQMSAGNGGQLNADWVSILMGFAGDWTQMASGEPTASGGSAGSHARSNVKRTASRGSRLSATRSSRKSPRTSDVGSSKRSR